MGLRARNCDLRKQSEYVGFQSLGEIFIIDRRGNMKRSNQGIGFVGVDNVRTKFIDDNIVKTICLTEN